MGKAMYRYRVTLFAALVVAACYASPEKPSVRQTGDYPETTRIDYCYDSRGPCRTISICYYPEVCFSPTLSPSGLYSFFFRRKVDINKPDSGGSRQIIIYDSKGDSIVVISDRPNQSDYYWIRSDKVLHVWSAGSDDKFAEILEPTGESVWQVAAPGIMISDDRKYLLTFAGAGTPVAVIQPVIVYQLPEGQEVARSNTSETLQDAFSVSWRTEEVLISYRDAAQTMKTLRLKLQGRRLD